MKSKTLLKKSLTLLSLGSAILAIGVPLFAVPATLTLPAGQRQGVEPLTIGEAARQLQHSGARGWALVESARSLVAERMQYSRRNSFDSAGRAFSRGYGYCTQMAFALAVLLRDLGFEARVVQAFRNRFPDGNDGAHAWVSVAYGGQTRYIDSLFWEAGRSQIDFEILSEVTEIGPLFKIFAYWGGTGVNAYRYYKTGVDH